MRFVTTLTLLTIAATTGAAHAGAALDAPPPPPPTHTTDPTASPDSLVTAGEKIDYGIDLRLRSVHVPQALLNLFVERSAGGASNTGIGVDLVRRRGNLELQLGFEYEHINVGEGIWINKGDVVPGNDPDYILSPEHSGNQFGWFTVEFTFMNHAPINKYLAFRYGGGAGLGIVTGELDHYNMHCAAGATNANPEPACTPSRFGGQGAYTDPDGNPSGEQQYKYSMPPVFPVVNAIIGLQIKPTEKSVINIEGGIRTLPFFGMSAGYFF
jgi:hypothetical protein